MTRRLALSLTLASAVAVTGATSYAVAGAVRPDHVARTHVDAAASPVSDLLGGSYHAGYARLSGTIKGDVKNVRLPKVLGAARVGEELTATEGTWNPGDVKTTYQWYADGKKIPGAKRDSLKVKPGLVGDKLTVQVTASKKKYRTATATSKASKAVRVGTIEVLDEPSISGRTKVGKTLVLDPGSYDVRGVRLDYQWYREGKVVKGATGTTYKLKAGDKGKHISAVVTVAKDGYRTATSVVTVKGKIS